jgi:alpha-L-fucosidase
MKSTEWFKDAKFGIMIHWGLYSLPAGEWNGKRMPMIGEWLQSYFRIPNKTYHGLGKAFNPALFNADEWVRTAAQAGMRYIVVTSKHHDGFALYRSKVDQFNLFDASPFRRDAVYELAEACSKYNMKFGLYYSQDLDWSDPNGGGYLDGHTNCGLSWTNDWDFPDNTHKNYALCFQNKILPQVHELLTGYGEISLIWFDTPRTISAEQSRSLYDLVKHDQPACLVNSRIGNGLGDYTSLGDNEIPDDFKESGLYEAPATLNDTWGCKSYDNNWKSAATVLQLKNHLNQRGVNYLLNVGPDWLGRFPAPACEILHDVGSLS